MGRAKAEQTLMQIDKLPGGETVETEIMSCLSLPMLDGIDERVSVTVYSVKSAREY